MKVPYTLWVGRKPEFKLLLRFSQEGHAFTYRAEAVANNTFLPRAILGNFLTMQSPRKLYRIFIPSMGKVRKCWEVDFKVSKEPLPSIQELMDL